MQLNSALTFLNDYPILCWVLICYAGTKLGEVFIVICYLVLKFFQTGSLPQTNK